MASTASSRYGYWKSCAEDDKGKIVEAETTAEESICARIRFWDGVLGAINVNRGN